VFTMGLDGTVASPIGPSGDRADELEVIASAGRDSETTCAPLYSASDKIWLTRSSFPTMDIGRLTFLVFSSDATRTSDDRWTARRLTGQGAESYTATSGAVPPAGMNPGELCGPALLEPMGNVAGSCALERLSRIAFANQVRYRVREDATGVPVLERSSTEQPGFQAIARGIEELQVQYTQVGSPTAWVDDAPDVEEPGGAPTNYATLVNQVRVTLTARSEARNVAGQMTAPGDATPRLRGSLTSTASPRSVLMHLAQGRPPSPMPSPGTWYWE
jgi:hypothetical protein